MTDFSKAKVGDRVYSMLHGEGKIVNVRSDQLLLDIEFNYFGLRVYGFDGCYAETASRYLPVLFWSKPEFVEPPAPKRPVKVRKVIWLNFYRNDESMYGILCSSPFPTKESAECMSKGDVGYIGAYSVEIEYEE